MKKVFLLLATLMATSMAFAVDLKPVKPIKPVVKVVDSLFIVGDMTGANTYLKEYKLFSLNGTDFIWNNPEGMEMSGKFQIRRANQPSQFWGVPVKGTFILPNSPITLNPPTSKPNTRSAICFPGKMKVTHVSFNLTTNELTYEGTPVTDFDVATDQSLLFQIDVPKNIDPSTAVLTYDGTVTVMKEEIAVYKGIYTVPESLGKGTLCVYVGDADFANYKFSSNGSVIQPDGSLYQMVACPGNNIVVDKKTTPYKIGDKLEIEVRISASWKAIMTIKIATQTAVDEVEASSIYANNGTIYSDAEDMVIYNLIGQDVTAFNGQLKGLYVVKAEGQTVKVNVQ